MAKRKPTTRGDRRRRARVHETLVRDLERLAELAPGGTPGRPLDVESPAQVDVIAEATACPLCGATLRLVEHAAETHDGVRLRAAHVRCTQCAVARVVYFRVAGRLLN